jgi:hypothetical protein
MFVVRQKHLPTQTVEIFFFETWLPFHSAYRDEFYIQPLVPQGLENSRPPFVLFFMQEMFIFSLILGKKN